MKSIWLITYLLQRVTKYLLLNLVMRRLNLPESHQSMELSEVKFHLKIKSIIPDLNHSNYNLFILSRLKPWGWQKLLWDMDRQHFTVCWSLHIRLYAVWWPITNIYQVKYVEMKNKIWQFDTYLPLLTLYIIYIFCYKTVL